MRTVRPVKVSRYLALMRGVLSAIVSCDLLFLLSRGVSRLFGGMLLLCEVCMEHGVEYTVCTLCSVDKYGE